jgi:hypothetical protein
MPSFYVTISDVPLTFVGVAALYLYLEQRWRLLMLLSFLSGFIRSGLPQLIGLLLAFPSDRRIAEQPKRMTLGWIAAAVGGGVLTVAAIYYGLIRKEVWVQDGLLWARPLSVLILCGYVTAGLYFLFRHLKWQDVMPGISDLAKAIIPIVAVIVMLKLFSGPSDLDNAEFFRRSMLTGLIFPGLSLLAHIVYFGPGVILAILLWRRVATEAFELGVGFVLVLALGVCLSINSESRTLQQYIPALTLAVTLAVAKCDRLPQWGYYLTAILCVIFAKIWMAMAGTDRIFDGQHHAFPEQRYFMNFGPWMSLQTYVWQGVIALASTATLAYWIYAQRGQAVPNLGQRRVVKRK